MNSSFLAADGTITPPRRRWWSGWLPSFDQVQQAIQLPLGSQPATAADTPPSSLGNAWTISMRQGLGLVALAALLAGLLPFLFNAIIAMRYGTALPLAQIAQETQDLSVDGALFGLFSHTWQTLAGLGPSVLPGWLAGLLTSLGAWINWPLRWLAWWIVYGTAVLVAAKVWGAPTTLQHFFAATSYAAVPLILVGLGPIPWLGFVAQVIAVLWMLAVYIRSVRVVTGLDWGPAVVAVLAPGALASLFGFVTLLAAATTMLRALF